MRRGGAIGRRGALVCGALVAIVVLAAGCVSGDFPERPVDAVQQGGTGGTGAAGAGGGGGAGGTGGGGAPDAADSSGSAGTGGATYEGGIGEADADAIAGWTGDTGGVGGSEGGGTGGSGGSDGSVDSEAAADVVGAGATGGAGGTGGSDSGLDSGDAVGGGGSGGTDGSVDGSDSGGSAGADSDVDAGDGGDADVDGSGGTDGACTPETDLAFCTRLGKNCGSVSAFDNCGGSRTVPWCGACSGTGVTCGGGGTPNVCGCTNESDAEFCARLGKNCNSVTANDNCGAARTVGSCGTCGGATPVCQNAVCVPRPSCTGLAATCGPSGDSDCCASSAIPGGQFYRSYDGAGYNDQTAPAAVSDFRLDLYEVTVGLFRNFVAAYPGNKPAAGAGKNPNNALDPGWDATWNGALPVDQTALRTSVVCSAGMYTWTDSPGGNETRPMNCLTWHEAFAFCIWDGGRLPTEVEWNYAAAGGSQQRAYPWSNPPNSTTIDPTYASYASPDCLGDGVAGCTVEDLINVGTKPAGNARWGHANMAGNVAEWVLDWFATYATPCTDCADTVAATDRVFRGGGMHTTLAYVRTAYRLSWGPNGTAYDVGARCARNGL